MRRRGDWMQTATGRQFWPIDPRPEEVHIEDIAHALSLMCRYGGHCLRFYSVAEHSVLVARATSPEHRLWALLHDAAEAYVADVIRPLKPFLRDYQNIEDGVMRAICQRFGLDVIMPQEVKDLDIRILMDEKAQNMALEPAPWIKAEPLGVQLRFWQPGRARAEFLRLFGELTHGMPQ